MVYLSCALICQIFCFSFPTVAWPISPLGRVRLQRPEGEQKKGGAEGLQEVLPPRVLFPWDSGAVLQEDELSSTYGLH